MIRTEMVSRAFKARLEELIKKSGKTQAENAAAIGIAAQNLSNFLNPRNKRMPRADMLMRISDHFNVSVDWLLGRAEGKTPNIEQIHKLLGLTDGAIKKLRKKYRHAGSSLPEGAYPSIISALIETEIGKELLDSIIRYVFADFSKAHGFDIENLKNSASSYSHVHFHAGLATGFGDSGFFMSTEQVAAVFIGDITNMVKDFRRAIQAGEYLAPYRPKDQQYPDPEAGMKQARKDLKARLHKETVYSTIRNPAVRKKGKHANLKYGEKATGQYIPSLSAELAQAMEAHRKRLYKQLLAKAERGRKHVKPVDSD